MQLPEALELCAAPTTGACGTAGAACAGADSTTAEAEAAAEGSSWSFQPTSSLLAALLPRRHGERRAPWRLAFFAG